MDSGHAAPSAADTPRGTPSDAAPLSARDAAAAVGVNERTIRRAIARGDLPAERDAGSYRIDPGALAAWLLARDATRHAPDTGQPAPHPAAPHAAPGAADNPPDSGQSAASPAAPVGVSIEVVAELRARLADAQTDRDRWADEAAGLRTLLQQAQAMALAERDRADALEARAIEALPAPANVVDVAQDAAARPPEATGRAEPPAVASSPAKRLPWWRRWLWMER